MTSWSIELSGKSMELSGKKKGPNKSCLKLNSIKLKKIKIVPLLQTIKG